jgi:hypothetical protein
MHKYWVEIKGQHPTPDELAKAFELYQHLGYPVAFFYGEPGKNGGYAYYSGAHSSSGGMNKRDDVNWVYYSSCDKVDLDLRSRDDENLYIEGGGFNGLYDDDIDYCLCELKRRHYDIRILSQAYTAAS